MAVPLHIKAAALLELRRRETESLYDFIPRISPRIGKTQTEPPRHLDPVVQQFERALKEPTFSLLSVPPQHGKTELILHALARLVRRRPELSNAYLTYGADRGLAMSVKCRDYAVRAGVKQGPIWAAHEWRTPQGGGLVAGGVGGPLTGFAVDGLLVIDDPFKNREEAESGTIREKVYEWFTSVAVTRMHPTTSIIVVHTRWHEEDLIGRLLEKRSDVSAEDQFPWQYTNLPAIIEEPVDGQMVERALWPSQRPLSFLRQRRDGGAVTKHDWWSMFMGQPRPRGGAVFHTPAEYTPDQVPSYGFQISIGIDCAYSEKTHADFSVAVVLAKWGEYFFVLDVVRGQWEVPTFVEHLKALKNRYPGAKFTWHTSTTEKGTAQLMKALGGINVKAELATADKFVRAQPVSTMWNLQRVLVPTHAEWREDFVKEVTRFTGLGDRKDDQVDALSSAYHPFAGPQRKRIDSDGTEYQFG